LGRAAGSLFKRITGLGDYTVTSNTLVPVAASDSLAAFGKSGRGIRITHREYLQDVITSPTAGLFKVESFPLQPGLPFTFPWLASIAQQFEEYQLNGMIFEFKSNSYDALASTNTASGTVIMTTNYNVYNLPFTNKQSMEQYQFTCSSKPSVDLVHPVECARGESPLVVLQTRNDAKLQGDLRLYDFGNFNIATVGMQGTSTNIGELWISYDITFYKPRVGTIAESADHYVMNSIKDIGTDGSAQGYFSSTPTLTLTSNLGTTVDSRAGRITFPPTFTGKVSVQYVIYTQTDAKLAMTNHVWTGAGGVKPLNIFGQVAPVGTPLYNGSTGIPGAEMNYNTPGLNGYNIVNYYSVTAGGTLTMSGGTAVPGPIVISADLIISTLPTDFE